MATACSKGAVGLGDEGVQVVGRGWLCGSAQSPVKDMTKPSASVPAKQNTYAAQIRFKVRQYKTGTGEREGQRVGFNKATVGTDIKTLEKRVSK